MKGFFVILFSAMLFITSCSDDGGKSGDAAFSGDKERDLKSHNLDIKKERAGTRTPCDTLALQEYILENYPDGTHLLEFDKTNTYNIPKPAVLYKVKKNKNYVFALIAKSKVGERYVEKKNLTGYESSFINLDSTKLGTAFFYLTLFECNEQNGFAMLWEKEVPIHGGFNYMNYKKWKQKNIEYISLNFEYGIISGHRDFNYFFIDGIRNEPHLLETYEGIAHKRSFLSLNDDMYPDYWEYRYVDTVNYNKLIDSIPFYWDDKKQLYTTPVSKRWTRKY
ncbi:MAG: hypothetical protein JEY94_02385 [Melioribacteraceae bacterium]|nr:hypothetical protein [Melioribacteraceae bacterium]